jgi:perosamine synthetase
LSKHALAIAGGEPAFSVSIPTWPQTSSEIRDAVISMLDDDSWGKYEGPWTSQLISRLQQSFASDHVFLCCSGTIAVELALRGLLVGPGDEVVMAGYDFPGNFRAIEAVGAFPVLIDVVKDGWVVDAQQIESAISSKTKAVIVSHLHGQIADIGAVRQAIDSARTKFPQDVFVVEDICQVPGAVLDGRPLGTFGDVAALSFGGSKLLSAGRGGAVVTQSAEIVQRTRIYNSRGNDAFPMSQLQAAVLMPQLDRLTELTAQRHQAATKLIESIADIEALSALEQVIEFPENAIVLPAYYKLPWLLKAEPTGWSRSDFIAALQAEGVPMDVGFRGFLRRTPRRCRKTGTLVNSQIAAQQTVLLPHPVLILDPDAVAEPFAEAIRKVSNSKPV